MHFCKTSLLIFVFALTASAAHALDQGQWTLDINGASWHSENSYFHGGQNRQYNESNLGLGLSYGFHDNLDLKVGFFDNSYQKTSVYAGAFAHWDFYTQDRQWVISPGAFLLLASGYENTPENAPAIAPVPGFAVGVGHRKLRLNLGYIPFGQVQLATAQLQILLD